MTLSRSDSTIRGRAFETPARRPGDRPRGVEGMHAATRGVRPVEFEKRGKEPFGAGGIGRVFVDGKKVAEGEIPNTTAFGYSLDETFDVGCDKGAPVTDEYPALASFNGKIVEVVVDLKPDFSRDDVRQSKEQFNQAMLRQ